MSRPPSSWRARSTFRARAERALTRALLVVVAAYRLVLRPLLPATCRFAPSCSAYARQAIVDHGPVRGVVLALRRIGRCHPWNAGGYDPVPARKG